jgi:hypothetical protein
MPKKILRGFESWLHGQSNISEVDSHLFFQVIAYHYQICSRILLTSTFLYLLSVPNSQFIVSEIFLMFSLSLIYPLRWHRSRRFDFDLVDLTLCRAGIIS